ncbi:MAG: endo-1,4-beta-xylanase [Dehalococcoidia bacterium]|nr:endo-1,4-beta-xylanase [Dehalococcoidia bacterium]
MLGLELYMQFPPNPGIHPQRDTFNFNWPDFVVGWSTSRGMAVHGGNLAWGTNAGYARFTPDWVKKAPTRNDAIAMLVEWVNALVARYPQVSTWTIVNEPWSHGHSDIWREKIGDDYPFIAAKAARDLNPDAALILNDYDNHLPTATADENLDLASRMVADGLLDGIGFQMHLDAKSPESLKKDDVKRNLARFAKLKGGNFRLLVTEFDVNLHGYVGTIGERWVRQALIYQAMLEALLEMGGKEFAIMGNTDELSWLTGLPTGGADSEGTPFMADWTPKPAYTAIYDVLRRGSQ